MQQEHEKPAIEKQLFRRKQGKCQKNVNKLPRLFYLIEIPSQKLRYQTSEYRVYGIHRGDSIYTDGQQDIGQRSMNINSNLQNINHYEREDFEKIGNSTAG